MKYKNKSKVAFIAKFILAVSGSVILGIAAGCGFAYFITQL